jgi:hypothetical protein
MTAESPAPERRSFSSVPFLFPQFFKPVNGAVVAGAP